MIGTPWEVPDPRKINEKGIRIFFLLPKRNIKARFKANKNGMLTTLRIKNLALVPDLTLELQPGLNIITGETGAGKSILIGALNLILGQRADRTLIRNDSESCSVEAIFDIAKMKFSLKELLDTSG